MSCVSFYFCSYDGCTSQSRGRDVFSLKNELVQKLRINGIFHLFRGFFFIILKEYKDRKENFNVNSTSSLLPSCIPFQQQSICLAKVRKIQSDENGPWLKFERSKAMKMVLEFQHLIFTKTKLALCSRFVHQRLTFAHVLHVFS